VPRLEQAGKQAGRQASKQAGRQAGGHPKAATALLLGPHADAGARREAPRDPAAPCTAASPLWRTPPAAAGCCCLTACLTCVRPTQ
jgi:hypothetical protein